MGQLDGKVAIVTRSARGIGQQMALRLAHDGSFEGAAVAFEVCDLA